MELTELDLKNIEQYYNSFSYSKGLTFDEISEAQKKLMFKSLGYRFWIIKQRKNKSNGETI